MTQEDLDEAIARALLDYSNAEAKKPPGHDRFNAALSLYECKQIVREVRRAIGAANCEIREHS